MRADVFLVEGGYAATRSQAQRLIAAGVQWRLAPTLPWQKVAKNGDDIPAGVEVQLLDAAQAKYLSRGGLKLEGALAATGLQVAGLRCLDVGQSTGGFTDCLLAHGAAQVIGVDVGHGQLHERLRADPRVVCVEGVNARALTPEALQDACDVALSEVIEDAEDNDTQPQAPYAWMRNGGVVDDEYDDSDDAKEHEIESFKAERAAKAKARAEGSLPVQRRRRPGCEDVDITPAFDLVTVLGNLLPRGQRRQAPLHARSNQPLRLRARGRMAKIHQKNICTHAPILFESKEPLAPVYKAQLAIISGANQPLLHCA